MSSTKNVLYSGGCLGADRSHCIATVRHSQSKSNASSASSHKRSCRLVILLHYTHLTRHKNHTHHHTTNRLGTPNLSPTTEACKSWRRRLEAEGRSTAALLSVAGWGGRPLAFRLSMCTCTGTAPPPCPGCEQYKERIIWWRVPRRRSLALHSHNAPQSIEKQCLLGIISQAFMSPSSFAYTRGSLSLHWVVGALTTPAHAVQALDVPNLPHRHTPRSMPPIFPKGSERGTGGESRGKKKDQNKKERGGEERGRKKEKKENKLHAFHAFNILICAVSVPVRSLWRHLDMRASLESPSLPLWHSHTHLDIHTLSKSKGGG